jgi:hypothetical protein
VASIGGKEALKTSSALSNILLQVGKSLFQGVDALIKIFCFFQQFYANVFLKNQCYDKFFLHNLALFWIKNTNFFANFLAKIFLKSEHRFQVASILKNSFHYLFTLWSREDVQHLGSTYTNGYF